MNEVNVNLKFENIEQLDTFYTFLRLISDRDYVSSGEKEVIESVSNQISKHLYD